MLKSNTLKFALTLGVVFSLQQTAFAQDDAAKSDKKAKQEVLVRPETSAGPAIDTFAAKAFDVYDESKKLLQAIEFVKVETKEVADKGDGVTTEVKISDGKGGELSKLGALAQLDELLQRTMKQAESYSAVMALQPAATQELATLSAMDGMKATKTLRKSVNALGVALNENKKIGSLISQQISTLKAMKNN